MFRSLKVSIEPQSGGGVIVTKRELRISWRGDIRAVGALNMLILLEDHALIVRPERLEIRELGLHELLYDCLVTHDEALFGEAILRILQKLSEGNAQAPGVRVVGLQPLNENARYLLLYTLVQNVVVEIKYHPRVEIGMTIDVSELVDNAVEQAHPCLAREHHYDLLEYLVALLLLRLLLLLALVLVCAVLDEECNRVEDA